MRPYVIWGILPKPKARPRVTGRATYMPKSYQDWRAEIRRALIASYGSVVPVDFRFHCEMVFMSKKRPRGDLDNLIGGVLDAIQCGKHDPWGLIKDDGLMDSISAKWLKANDGTVFISILFSEAKQ